MDFVFMLTRDDQTVRDGLAVLDHVAAAGITHVGFKDIGVPFDELGALHARMRELGMTTYLEVVSETPEDALSSARLAVELGVDRLLGGTDPEPVLALLAGSATAYLPFPGEPVGHPTRLGGDADRVATDCRRFAAIGCAGVDLLAYRATDADPLALVRAARAATDGVLLVAGSVTSREQVHALAAAGTDAFTIGSAAFEGRLDPRAGLLDGQLAAVAGWLADAPQRPS